MELIELIDGCQRRDRNAKNQGAPERQEAERQDAENTALVWMNDFWPFS